MPEREEPGEQGNLVLLEAAIDAFTQSLENEQLKWQANTCFDLYEKRVLIQKRRVTDMLLMARETKEQVDVLAQVIREQKQLIEKQTKRIQQLISLLHVPKDAEPIEPQVTIVEEYSEQDAFSDGVKRLQQAQDVIKEPYHDGIEYHDEGI